jgi:hypothetical protein
MGSKGWKYSPTFIIFDLKKTSFLRAFVPSCQKNLCAFVFQLPSLYGEGLKLREPNCGSLKYVDRFESEN